MSDNERRDRDGDRRVNERGIEPARYTPPPPPPPPVADGGIGRGGSEASKSE